MAVTQTSVESPLTLDVFERDAERFLHARTAPRPRTAPTEWGRGSDRVALFEERASHSELDAAKAWRAKKFDAGFGWVTGPLRLGGRGLAPSFERAWDRLESNYDVPVGRKYFSIGLGIVAPAILHHATDALAGAVLPGLYRGDALACQLFSEPGAGSDLASASLRATRDGDGWRLSGQKTLTSVAHLSDWGLALCRSDPGAPKHRGLTMFVVDLHAAGVTVRPLRQMTGGASFNEVFFDDVWVPDTPRLDAGAGWRVATTALMNERAAVGVSGGGGSGGGLTSPEGLAELIRRHGRSTDPVIRQRYAEVYSLFRITRFTVERGMQALRAQQTPGPELSTVKLLVTKRLQLVAALVSAVLGAELVADSGEWATYSWAPFVLGAPGMRIGGGTDEVLKNLLAERALALPQEPAP